MKFPPAFLDEIRARLPVSEVVGKRVKLRKQGREWAGLSPFNAEKTPSFFVNDQKGFFHDFSSGKHGDIFAFLIETEGLSFPEAVERLADMAGVPMPRQTRERARSRTSKRASLARGDGAGGARSSRARLQRADRREGARLSRRPRASTPPSSSAFRSATAPPERFALARRAGGQGRRRRADDRGGTADPRRRHRRAL